MFLKKLLATVASIALTGGALLGVSAPAFANDAVPALSPDVSATEYESAPPSIPVTPESISSAGVDEVVAPSMTDPVPMVEQSQPRVAPPVVTEATAHPSSSGVRGGKSNDDGTDKKVWVCKFVSSDNAPHGYRLKEGKQPIHVSANALGADVSDSADFTVARQLSDSQPSFVVAEDSASLCLRSVVTVDEEVECPTYQYGGVVRDVSTTKLYFGETQMGISITQSSRALTTQEQRACDPTAKVFVCQFEASATHPSGWVLTPGKQPVLTLLNELTETTKNARDYTDAQPSFIVASDDSSLCSSQQEEHSERVTCPTLYYSNGYATITTALTFLYGSVIVQTLASDEVRQLSDSEMRYCPPVEIVQATAEATLSTAGCNAPQQLILGSIVNATWGEVTDPDGPLDYSVTATADPGAEFSGIGGAAVRVAAGTATLTFSGTLEPRLDPSDPECDLATLGLVMPAVTFSQTSCTAGGSYRLDVAPGYDPALVTFTVNGVAGVVAGTYPVAAPGAVRVTAQAVGPNGLEFDWSDPPPLTFLASGDLECDTALPTLALPTLAFTGGGSSGPLWWLGAASIILLGGAAIYVRRRMDSVN